MQSFWNLPKLIYKATALKLGQINANHTADYDRAASSYDNYYSRHLGKSALSLWKKLPVKQGNIIVDLACGTGFFTRKLAEKVGDKGEIFAVDLSEGMLEQNRQKAKESSLNNITFVLNDAMEFLYSVPDNSLDGVVCGWGICYMDHSKLKQELDRVIKPGGFVGLIENKARTLKDVSDLFSKALIDYPDALVKNTVLHLPKNQKYLAKIFGDHNFKLESAWDGEVIVPCKNGQEIIDYMLKSGASAGFLDSLNKDMISQVFQTFVRYANDRFEQGDQVLVKHEYCAVVSTKM